MKPTLFAAVVAIGLAHPADASDTKSEVAADFALCSAYFRVAERCLRNMDDGGEPLASQQGSLAQLAREFSIRLSNEETADARILLYVRSLVEGTEEHCSNLARIIADHGHFCRDLMNGSR